MKSLWTDVHPNTLLWPPSSWSAGRRRFATITEATARPLAPSPQACFPFLSLPRQNRGGFRTLSKTWFESLMQVYVHGFYMMLQVVGSLLDITKAPRKPQYTMAPEVPLILLYFAYLIKSALCVQQLCTSISSH